MNNIFGKFLQQAKSMQEELKKIRIEGSAGAGMVSVLLDGRYQVQNIKVDDEIYKEEKSVLLELIAAAFNDGARKVEQNVKEKMAQGAAMLGVPGNFKFPFSEEEK